MREIILKLFELLGVTSNRNGSYMNKNTLKNIPGINNTIVIITIICSLLVIIWLLSGFYTVNTDEEAVVLRLGVYHRTVGPGLNYKLPMPIETAEKISVTRINKEFIGTKFTVQKEQKRNIVGFSTSSISGFRNENADSGDVDNSENSQMLTLDENIIETHFFVQWLIKDAKDYLFNIKDESGTESTVRVVAESVMREVIGQSKLHEALSEQRQGIEKKAKEMLQATLDMYKSGIQIQNLGILYSYVAPEVRDAYRDVQSAKADKEREINKAYAYRNEVIPKARGEAQMILEEAKAYKDAVISQAIGEADRFNSVYTQYQKAKYINKKRIYIETMENVLKNVNKIIINNKVVDTISNSNKTALSKSNNGQLSNNSPLVILNGTDLLNYGSNNDNAKNYNNRLGVDSDKNRDTGVNSSKENATVNASVNDNKSDKNNNTLIIGGGSSGNNASIVPSE